MLIASTDDRSSIRQLKCVRRSKLLLSYGSFRRHARLRHVAAKLSADIAGVSIGRPGSECLGTRPCRSQCPLLRVGTACRRYPRTATVLPNVDLLVVDDSKSIGDDSVSTAGGCLHKSWISLLVVVLPVLLIGPTKLRAVDCCDPNSPFREGEGWADEPATCENIRTGPNGLRQRTHASAWPSRVSFLQLMPASLHTSSCATRRECR
jgi:hypothetical protein